LAQPLRKRVAGTKIVDATPIVPFVRFGGVLQNPLIEERWLILHNLLGSYRRRLPELAFLSAAAILIIGAIIIASAKFLPPQLVRLEDGRVWLVLGAIALAHSYSAAHARRAGIAASWWQQRVVTRRAILADLLLLRALEISAILTLLAVARPAPLTWLLMLLLLAASAVIGSLLALNVRDHRKIINHRAIASVPPHATAISARLPLPYLAQTQWTSARWSKPAQFLALGLLVSIPMGAKGVNAVILILSALLIAGLLRAWVWAMEEIADWHPKLRSLPYRRQDLLRTMSLRPLLLLAQTALLVMALTLYVDVDWRVGVALSGAFFLVGMVHLLTAFAHRDHPAQMRLRGGIAVIACVALPVAIGPWSALLWLTAVIWLWRRAHRI
jgi:hypothetical protein